MSLLFFVLGAVMGSTANALIDRLPRGESWVAGRSHCDKCKHALGFWDLIPIVSFLWLGGRCRYCRSPIPYRNFIVELLVGVGFLSIFNLKFEILNQISIFNVLISQFIFWITVVIAVMDWETRLVSEKTILIWGMLAVVQLHSFTVAQLAGLAVGVGVIGGIWAISKGRAMGFGDVEIAVVMGWWLGWPKIAVALWVAFVTGAVVGVWRLAIGLAKLKSEMAFGTFLLIGTWIAYIWGVTLWNLIF